MKKLLSIVIAFAFIVSASAQTENPAAKLGTFWCTWIEAVLDHSASVIQSDQTVEKLLAIWLQSSTIWLQGGLPVGRKAPPFAPPLGFWLQGQRQKGGARCK